MMLPKTKNKFQFQQFCIKHLKKLLTVLALIATFVTWTSTKSVPKQKIRTGTKIRTGRNDRKEWPHEVQLFAPVFPGGEAELKATLLRSLAFFWPKNHLNILFLVDHDAPERDEFGKRIVEVASNFSSKASYVVNTIPKQFYRRGWDRQQLIMFWADNFTDAEYVGFVDDDTVFTNYVLREDIFDAEGRPRVIGYSNANQNQFWQDAMTVHAWIYNGETDVIKTMSHFPVVVKTSHLKEIREAVLNYHPEFNNFDEFFAHMNRMKKPYGQFNIMHHYLWYNRRDEYAWSLEGFAAHDKSFLTLPGVTPSMLQPIPRCSLHLNYDPRNKGKRRANFINEVLQRGFCYSLTKEDFEGDYGSMCTKARYNWTTVNNIIDDDQWIFEDSNWLWDENCLQSHIARHTVNRKKEDWDQEELKKLFEA